MLEAETLLKECSGYLKPDDLARLQSAYQFSELAHHGQFRNSGEPYVSHPVAVAGILAGLHLDAQALTAALLHDVMEDTEVTKAEITKKFGKPVAELVDGVSKLDRIEFETMVIANAARHESRPLPTPYFGHEEQFIRIALHLHYRAALAGVDTIPNLLCAGRRYCLSHAHRYIEAIGDEPADLLELPFAEISRSPPPEAFIALWLNDVSRYLECCPQTLNGVLS